MDITNPVILLKADNPLETDVEIDAVLTPKKNNVNIEGHEVKIGTGYGQNKVALIPGTISLLFLVQESVLLKELQRI